MKKFVISSEDLRPALKRLTMAVASNPALPLLSNIYCKVGKDEIEFITSDLELTIMYRCPVVSEGAPFEMLLPFDFTSKATSFMHNDIHVEFPSARKARIVDTPDVYDISLDKLDEYPNIPATPKKNSISLDEKFLQLLKIAMTTTAPAGPDKKEDVMSNVLLDLNKKESCVVSTDRYSLFKHTIDAGLSDHQQFLFSHKIAKALVGLGAGELSWTEKHTAFRTDKITIIATNKDMKYVDYKAALNKDTSANLVVDRLVIIDKLQKACLSSSETKQTTVYLKKDPGVVHFEVYDEEKERKIQLDFPAEYTGDVDTISFNAEKLLNAMEQLNVEKVKFHIEHANKPVLISTEQDPGYTGLIIPLKINN